MKAGDLVKLGPATDTALDIPYETIGVVIQEKGDVCSVLFATLDGEIRSFMKRDLEIVSAP